MGWLTAEEPAKGALAVGWLPDAQSSTASAGQQLPDKTLGVCTEHPGLRDLVLLPGDSAEAIAFRYNECVSCFGHSSDGAGSKVMPALSGKRPTNQELVAAVVEVMPAAEVQCLRQSHPCLPDGCRSHIPATLSTPLPPHAGMTLTLTPEGNRPSMYAKPLVSV